MCFIILLACAESCQFSSDFVDHYQLVVSHQPVLGIIVLAINIIILCLFVCEIIIKLSRIINFYQIFVNSEHSTSSPCVIIPLTYSTLTSPLTLYSLACFLIQLAVCSSSFTLDFVKQFICILSFPFPVCLSVVFVLFLIFVYPVYNSAILLATFFYFFRLYQVKVQYYHSIQYQHCQSTNTELGQLNWINSSHLLMLEH